MKDGGVVAVVYGVTIKAQQFTMKAVEDGS